MTTDLLPPGYAKFLNQVKQRIQQARTRAALAVSAVAVSELTIFVGFISNTNSG